MRCLQNFIEESPSTANRKKFRTKIRQQETMTSDENRFARSLGTAFYC